MLGPIGKRGTPLALFFLQSSLLSPFLSQLISWGLLLPYHSSIGTNIHPPPHVALPFSSAESMKKRERKKERGWES